MSSSLAIAVPSPLPLALLPLAPQTTGAILPGATQSESSPSAVTVPSFSELVNELIQNAPRPPAHKIAMATPDTVSTDAQPPQLTTSLRIPLPIPAGIRQIPASPSVAPSPKRERRTENEVSLVVPGPPPPLQIALPREQPLPVLISTSDEPFTNALVETRAEAPAAPRELLTITPDDTVFQIRLRTGPPDLSNAGEPARTTTERAARATSPPASILPSQTTEKPGTTTNVDHGAPQGSPPSLSNPGSDADPDNKNATPRREIKAPVSHAIPEFEGKSASTISPTVPGPHPTPAPAPVAAEPPRAPAPLSAAAPPPAPVRSQEPNPPAPQPQQQVRSMSLEFTPDGGRDVRLRVVERGGEVHVSLHSTDNGLTGRLREGVQDLAGTLINAGYDAEAWTPQDNPRRQQPEDPPEFPRRRSQSTTQDEDFAGLLGNPIQETR